jgi:lysozyme
MTPSVLPPERQGSSVQRLRPILWAALLLPSLIVGAGLLYQAGLVRFNYPARAAYPVRGLDVSHHQGPIAWSRLPKGAYAFAYLKASEGADWVDPQFRANWQGAQAAGLKVGAYHFFTLCKGGLEQAKNFIALVPDQPGMLAPAVDLELGGNCAARPSRTEFLTQLSQFMDLMVVAYGARPVLYTTVEFAEAYLPDDVLRGERVWLRDIFHRPRGALAGQWTLWQFANNGAVPGVGKRVDLDVFHGSKAEFRRLTIQPASQFAQAE